VEGLIEPHLPPDDHAIQNDKLALGKATCIPASIKGFFQLHKVGECGSRLDALGHGMKFRAHFAPPFRIL